MVCHRRGSSQGNARAKFGNVPTRSVTGALRHSRKEAAREAELVALERAGAIKDLRSQVRYDLSVYGVPAVDALLEIIEGDTALWARLKEHVRTVRWSRRHVATYVADFVYEEADSDRVHVEDPKGYQTEVFRLKARLFRICYGREIEVS